MHRYHQTAALILALVLAFCLVACGGGRARTAEPDSSAAPAGVSPEPAPPPSTQTPATPAPVPNPGGQDPGEGQGAGDRQDDASGPVQQAPSAPDGTGEADRAEGEDSAGGEDAAPVSGGAADADSADAAQGIDGAPTTGDGEQAAGTLIDWMQAGVFRFDFDMAMERGGFVSQAKGSLMAAGVGIAMSAEMPMGEQLVKARFIIQEGVAYMVDDASRLIMQVQGAMEEITGGIPMDYSNMAFVGEGMGECQGKMLPYEQYAVDGVMVQYFLEDGQVYGIVWESDVARTLMIVEHASNQVPAEVFALPEGYMQL